MTKLEDFLGAIPSQQTRKSYRNGIRKFEEYLGKPIESLTKSKNPSREVEKFYVWLKNNGYTQNSCRNITNGAIQYLKFLNVPMKYRKALGIYRTEISTRDHHLTIKELQEMGSVADLKEQVILEVFILGLRVADASRLEWQLFDVSSGQETPIPIEIRTRKEGIIAHTFITKEFFSLLEKYLSQIDRKNKYLLQSSRQGFMDEETLNWTLKELAKRANLTLRGNLHWHCGRKLFLRTCAELGINQWNAKLMCGKSVEKDIETYIDGISLKGDFLKLSNVLRLRPETQGNGRVENIQQALDLVFKVLRKLCEEELARKQYAEQRVGIIADKEFLENFLETIEWIRKEGRKHVLERNHESLVR